MDENNSNPSATAAAAASAAQQQQLLLQQQLFIMQQQQQQQQQHQQQQQQQNQRPRSQIQQPQLQQAMSRFPSNIDAHLRPRSFQFNQNQSQNQMHMQQGQQQMMRSTNQSPIARNPEVEMALQDAFKVCNPDVRTPFTSIEDAVNRLLPYHVVSDYEAEEDDKILETDKTGQVPSRLQQWDHNILVKIAEFTSTFEKQVLAFNIMTRKRSLGEFRSEERLLLEQALIQEERRAAMEAKMEMESREKAARMTSSSTSSLVHQDFSTPGPPRTAAIRSHAVATQAEDAQDHGAPWVNNSNSNVNNNNNNENSNENEEGEEDFLNGEDDNDDDEEFDLNER